MKRLEVRLRPMRGSKRPQGEKVACPSDVRRVCRDLLDRDRELFVVLHLDPQNRLVARETVAIGSLTSTLLTCREVFKGAILNNSAAVVLVHNHPSGDPTPSRADLEITGRLRAAGDLLGIPVLDHVVVACGGYRSVEKGG